MYTELVDDYRQRDADELDAEYRALELQARALEARRLALLQVIDSRQVGRSQGYLSTNAYLRGVAHASGGAANAAIRRARTCRDAPEVGDALAAGHIGLSQVDEFARIYTNTRVRDLLPAAAPRLLGYAEHRAHAGFRDVVDRFIMCADLDGAWREQTTSVDERAATVAVVGDEVAVSAHGGDQLLAEQLKKVFDRFLAGEVDKDLAARKAEHGDRAHEFALPRSHRQRCFDALVAIFTAANSAANAGLDDLKLPDVVVNVLADEATFEQFLTRAGIVLSDDDTFDPASLDDSQIEDLLAALTDDPDELLDRRVETESGRTIHPLLLLRALLTERVRRVLVNAKGTVVNLGRASRLFTGAAREAALLVKPRCEFPGCELDGNARQVDHNIEWNELGRTDQDNATVLHGAHNRFKHHARWKRRHGTNGHTYWQKPDGTLVLATGQRPPPALLNDDPAA